MQNFFLFYHTLRKQNKKIKLKLILNKNFKPFYLKHYKPTGFYNAPDKIKFIDFKLPTGIFIFKDHVINIIADEKVTAFDVKSHQNAKYYKEFFDSIWNQAKC